MILCDSCQTKSCDKILSYDTLFCDYFIPPLLDVKVGDVVWVVTHATHENTLGNLSITFFPCKEYITSIDARYLNFNHSRINKSKFKTVFFLTEEECEEVCNIYTRKARELNVM